MKRYVLYTAIVGGYDKIAQPSIIDSDFDYILFSNDIPEERVGVWQVRKIPYKNADNTRVARWVKLHPDILLDSYEYSLWHDSNIIVDSYLYYERIKKLINRQVLLASMSHNERDCIYDEAYKIIELGLDNKYIVLKEVEYLKGHGYPLHYGLIETNCILRKHKEDKVRLLNTEWWNMINLYSRRDQLSFNYIAWKHDINIELILPRWRNSRNHTYLHAVGHSKWDTSKSKLVWNDLRSKICRILKPCYYSYVHTKTNTFAEKYYKGKLWVICRYLDIITKKYIYSTLIKEKLQVVQPSRLRC